MQSSQVQDLRDELEKQVWGVGIVLLMLLKCNAVNETDSDGAKTDFPPALNHCLDPLCIHNDSPAFHPVAAGLHLPQKQPPAILLCWHAGGM